MSTNIPKPFITLDLTDIKPVCRVDIAWADVRQYHFDISVSTDGTLFTDVLIDRITGISTNPEWYTFPATQARFVKITITESTPGIANVVAQVSEINIFGP